MTIGLLGTPWRRDFTGNMIRQLGLLAACTDNPEAPVILAASLTSRETEKLKEQVAAGAVAVVLYPERGLLSLFGDELPYTHSFPLLKAKDENLPFHFLQVFPHISLITPREGEIWASFALDFDSTRSRRTSRYPAVIWRDYGKGRLGLFLYDLPSTILVLQQGREFFSSTGDFPPPPNAVARSARLGDGLINRELAHLPQAYFHEIILLKLLRHLCRDRDPLPRLWTYPYPHTSALVLSGDSDNLPAPELEIAWNKLRDWRAPYTQFITLSDLAPWPAADLAARREDGLDFGFHYFAGLTPSESEMTAHLREGRTLFEKKSLPFLSARGHALIWSGWDEQVRAMSEAGLRLSSTLMFLWGVWGNTRGLPHRLYTRQGRSPVFELPIYAEDDITLQDKTGFAPRTCAEAARDISGTIITMKDLYYQPVTCNFHPHYFVSHKPATTEWLEAAIASAHQYGLPVMNAARMLAWWEKRAAVTGSCTREGDNWKCTLSSVDREISLAVPARWNGRTAEGGKPLPGTGEVLLDPAATLAHYSDDVI